jgi:hypothetical protein
MHLTQGAIRKSTIAEIYRSDFAYWIGMVLIWELVVALLAMCLVPLLLAAAAASAPLMTDPAVLGTGARRNARKLNVRCESTTRQDVSVS